MSSNLSLCQALQGALAEPHVLRPFHRSEALSIVEAAAVAGRPVRTMRRWCLDLNLGRKIGGAWAVSKVALAMHLDGNLLALEAYHAGDRSSAAVAVYFHRCEVVMPNTANAATSTYKQDDARPIV